MYFILGFTELYHLVKIELKKKLSFRGVKHNENEYDSSLTTVPSDTQQNYSVFNNDCPKSSAL